MNRKDLLSLLGSGKSAISVHEHIGCESLAFKNGVVNDFRQNISALFKDLSALNIFDRQEKIASVVMTMQHLQQHELNGYRDSLRRCNHNLLKKCANWHLENPNLIPLPFVNVGVYDELGNLEKLVVGARYPVMGFKIHPRARNFSLDELLDSGLLQKVAELKLPLLMHCTRKGQDGSLQDIFRHELPYIASKLSLKLCIAHAGFLDEDIVQIRRWPGIYTDLSPWSVLTMNVMSTCDLEENIQRMFRLINAMPERVLYGGDSPYDQIKWLNGVTYGQGRHFDYKVLEGVVRRAGSEIENQIFFSNPIDFLS